MGQTTIIEFSGRCYKIMSVWKLREFERDNLEVLEGGKGIEVVTAIAQGGESLEKKVLWH